MRSLIIIAFIVLMPLVGGCAAGSGGAGGAGGAAEQRSVTIRPGYQSIYGGGVWMVQEREH